jgi:GntR family transcriptional regulator, transcriptional repressor for pyruvate dehydrogenase complex
MRHVAARTSRPTAAESVARHIQEMIESRELKPTEKLPSEAELARLFGVSRPIVREALGSLKAIGLIYSHTGRGSFVARNAPTPILLQGTYSLRELVEVRLLLEPENAAIAAEQRTEEELEHLRVAIEELSNCTDVQQWIVLDAAFHRVLGEATGNKLRAHLVEHLQDMLIEHARVVLTVEGRFDRANAEHRAIYLAVAAGDPRAARHAVSVHLRNSYEEIVAAGAGDPKTRLRAARMPPDWS